jgi:hypothetical protein
MLRILAAIPNFLLMRHDFLRRRIPCQTILRFILTPDFPAATLTTKLNFMTKDQLQKFCDPLEGRNIAKAPFNYGGYTWATNGKILVRVPFIAGVPDFAGQAAANLFGDGMVGTGIALPPIPPPVVETCKECAGKGYLEEIKCPDCKGEGECDCPTCGHAGDCTRCSGSGYIFDATASKEPCGDCDGQGHHETLASIEVGIARFQNRYLRLIAALPGLEFQPHGPLEPGRFRWDGGEGMLMPVKRA